MQTIPITGATGFAGSNISNLFQTSPDGANFVVRRSSRNSGRTDMYGDFALQGVADRVLDYFRPDIILHFAGCVPRMDATLSDETFERDNQIATENLVSAAKALPHLPHIVFYSTAALYPPGGIMAGVGSLESRARYAAPNEALPVDEIPTAYGRSKRAAELAVLTYPGPWTILRKPTVIGLNDQRGNFLQRLLLHIHEQTSPAFANLQRAGDYISMNAVFDATMRALTVPAAREAIFNLGAGRPITGFEAWRTMFAVADERGFDTRFAETPPERPGDAYPGTLLDIQAARDGLDYKADEPFMALCRIMFDDIMERPKPRAYLRGRLGLEPSA
jgi:nucleoside-diphosphate-sugar epimerase